MTITIFNHKIPDLTHDHYDVTFNDNTICTLVTDTPCLVNKWISKIKRIHRHCLHPLIVGLDVEWRPNPCRHVQNPVATLQLCVGNQCLIFQILYSPCMPKYLVNFLKNPNYTFVGVGIENDVEKLWGDYNLVVKNTLDLRELAYEMYGKKELKNTGLKGLTKRLLKKEVDKPIEVTLSKWDRAWLCPGQVKYACVDAYLSFEIGKFLIAGFEI